MADDQDWARVWWERLIDYLDAFASASAVGPDRIHVRMNDREGTTHDVIIIMSPDEWSDLYSTIWGNFDDAALQIKESLETLPAEHPFLIYRTYELHPSKTERIAEDPELAQFREHLRKNPGAVGEWRAYRRDGSYATFPEPPPHHD